MNSRSTLSAEERRAHWPEALATVLECKYDVGAGRALAFGLPTSKHFRIRYNYFADGQFHEGQFSSEKALPQGHLFAIRYDPDAPHQNIHPAATPARTRGGLLALGVAGSVLLSLAWLALMHGCS